MIENIIAVDKFDKEMGFVCDLKEIFSFIYKVELDDNLFENEYDHVFMGIYDGEILPNKDEVDDYKWATLEDIEKDIKIRPELYTYWFKCLFEKSKNEFNKYIKEKN